MKDNYKVYVHISPNGKRYYGITSQEPEKRWGKNGYGYKKNEYFTKAINKYGWDNFEHIVIARGLTKDEAKWVKIELIREWDTTNPEYGYNESRKKPRSEETKQKISKSHIGLNHTDETKNKIGESHKGKPQTEEHRNKIGEFHKGKTVSEETREKISKSNKGKCHKPTRVYCVELDMYFETVTEAGKYIGRAYGNISSVLTGRNKTCGGYHWMYAKDVENKGVS